MEEVAKNKVVNKKAIIKAIIVFLLILFTGFAIFRNDLAFEGKNIREYTASEAAYNHYVTETGDYAPIDGDACISLYDISFEVDEASVHFEKGLLEDTQFLIYKVEDGGSTFVDSVILRKGATNLTIAMKAKGNLNSVRMYIRSSDSSRQVAIPSFKASVTDYTFMPFQAGSGQWWLKFSILFVVSAGLSCLIAFFLDRPVETNSEAPKKAGRESGLELLRIICMFCIVGHHFTCHGGGSSMPHDSIVYQVSLLFAPLGKVCFLAFIAISMWFFSESRKVNFTRFLKVWLEVLFYSVVFTIVTYAYGVPLGFKDFFASFFVMIGNSHGFAASYLLFLLVLPLLMLGTNSITKGQARYALVILFFVQVVSKLLGSYIGYTQPIASELLLFVFCYFLSLNLRRFPIKIVDKWWFSLSVFLLSTGLIYLKSYLLGIVGIYNWFTTLLTCLTIDESSLLYIIAGYSLFFSFKHIKIDSIKVINVIASFTFAVLLIHDHNFFRHTFWYNVVGVNNLSYSDWFIPRFLLMIVTIFICCSTIEYLRKCLIEKPIFSIGFTKNLVDKYNNELFRDLNVKN